MLHSWLDVILNMLSVHLSILKQIYMYLDLSVFRNKINKSNDTFSVQIQQKK